MPSPKLSSPGSAGPLCRICFDGGVSESLETPCRCSGTIGLVHKTCLQRWLVTSNTEHCDLCKYRFDVRRKPRPISEWFNTSGHERDLHNFYGDFGSWIILTPLACLSIYLCVSSAIIYLQEGNPGEAASLLGLCAILGLIYLIWMVVSIRYHVAIVQKWRQKATVMELVSVKRRTPIKREIALPPEIVIHRCPTARRPIAAKVQQPVPPVVPLPISTLENVDEAELEESRTSL